MVTRADLTGTRPLTLVEPTVPVRTSSDARQETFSRLTQIAIGKQIQAEVLADIGRNTFLVRVEGTEARVNLPAGTKVGDQLPMTMLAHSPRPTLLLGAKPEPESTTLSGAARLIASILQDAGDMNGKQPVAARTPLLPAAPARANATPVPQLAAALGEAVDTSGLFYESHLQQWMDGQHSLTQLMREPQAQSARAMAPLATALPALARLLGQVTAGNAQGRNLAQVLQSPQFMATAGPVLREARAAQPVLERLLTQIQALAAPAQAAPGAAAEQASEAPATIANQATALTAPVKAEDILKQLPQLLAQLPPGTLQPAAAAVAQAVVAHPALGTLLLFFGAPAQAAQSPNEMLAAPQVQQMMQAAAQETQGDQSALQALILPADNSFAANARQATETLVHAADIDAHVATDADTLMASQAQPAASGELTQLISQQLHTLENHQFIWQGELWPGQKMEWEIEEDRSSARQQGGEQEQAWNSAVRLAFPSLGNVTAAISLQGEHVSMKLSVGNESVASLLRAHGRELSDALAAAGSQLDALLVNRNG